MPAPIVQLIDVNKQYPMGKRIVEALKGIQLDVREGEFTSIAGPSGSGKTTLLNLIGCVDIASSGVVRVSGQNTRELTDSALTHLRLRDLGFIFQSFNLVPVLSLYQNVELPLLLQGGINKQERQMRVLEIVEQVGLTDQLHQRPTELSGGQRQRVAIARALVTQPRLVLADEPTANLDSVTGTSIIHLMRRLNEEHHTTFIFSTHDPRVLAHATRVVHMEDGAIKSDSAVEAHS